MLTTLSRLDEATDRRGIPNWLSTHPQPEARVERVSATVKSQTGTRQDWTTNRDDYLQRLDGMIFGDDPDDGIVRDNVFLHPSMRLSVEFPLDWPINNGKEQVVAKNPSADEYMVLQMIERVQGRSLDEVADRQMSKMGWKPRSRSATKVNGLDAVLGIYDGSVSKLGSVTAHVLHAPDVSDRDRAARSPRCNGKVNTRRKRLDLTVFSGAAFLTAPGCCPHYTWAWSRRFCSMRHTSR